MALADTGRAIGAVTQLLQSRLFGALGSLPQAPIQEVTVGRPEPKPTAGTKPRLNLFLYEVEFDGHLMNVSLDAGQPVPIWLVLRYLMTAFDNEGESDSIRAQEILGQGIRVLQASNFLLPTAQTTPALGDNPDLLKLTFEDASSELLSRLMQGTDERYRCSVAFQVRPVLVAPLEPPSYSLLVGVDYVGGTVPGQDALHVPVLASLGPEIARLDPDAFETGEEVTVHGVDLHLGELSVLLGSERLGVTSQKPDRLTFSVPISLEDGLRLSAGSHALYVEQALPTGRSRKSNPLLAGLLPGLEAATPAGVQPVQPANPASPVQGTVTLDGVLLGTAEDEVYVGLLSGGRVLRLFDTFTHVSDQKQLTFTIPAASPIVRGVYRVILRVNGRQARNSPEVSL
jgi:hypothetical protein